MAKETKADESKSVKPKQDSAVQQELVRPETANLQSTNILLTPDAEPNLEAVVARIKDDRIPSVQRQALVSHVGQRYGNQFLQRVMDRVGADTAESSMTEAAANSEPASSKPINGLSAQRNIEVSSDQSTDNEIQRWDWERAGIGGLAGAAGGAAVGAGIGSIFGGVGAIPGAIVGGVVGGVGGALIGGLTGGEQQPQGSVDHTSGEQVDAYVDASPFIQQYIEEKAENGIRAEGHVHIHTPAEFVDEWVAYAMQRTNSDTGSRYTEEEARAREPNINAFRDGTEIHIHQDRGETGTAIHESMHLYSDDGYRNRVGGNANEGTTEHFTRMVCDEQNITRGAFYTSQRRSVDKLATTTSDDLLAGAYFQGSIDALESSVDSAAGENGYTNWINFMKQGRYTDADALL